MPTHTHSLYRRPAHLLALVILLTFITAGPGDTVASPRRRTPVVEAVQAARGAVVNIHGPKTITSNESGSEETRQVNGMGTGVVIDPRGYIITNYHVIEGVRRIQITSWEGKTYIARQVARDPQTDLAIIRIDVSQELPLIRIGTSADLMPGEPVVAVGNAYGYHNTVTRGIISALDRTVDVNEAQQYFDLIQTDASINPGNSGGPLLNADGEMIGINVAVRVGAQGIGFAIPVDTAMQVAADLIADDAVNGTWAGITGTSRRHGDQWQYVVRRVQSGTPAAVAGIKSGDVIRSVNGVKVQRELDLHRAVLGRKTGQLTDIKIGRSQAETDLSIVLTAGNRPRRNTALASGVEADAWQVLGLRVSAVKRSELGSADASYNGGLRVTAVKGDGLASQHGIRAGDILVGMHVWETASLRDLDYVLNKAQLVQGEEIQFYVLRDEKTRVGQLPLLRR